MGITKIISALTDEEVREVVEEFFPALSETAKEDMIARMIKYVLPNYELKKIVPIVESKQKEYENRQVVRSTKKVPVTVAGIDYPSIAKAARVLDIGIGTVRNRMKRDGIDAGEAMENLVIERQERMQDEEEVEPVKLTVGGDKLKRW